MSVASELGLQDGLHSPVLIEAGQRWSRWHATGLGEARDDVPKQLVGLRPWLRSAEPADADRVLHGLVRIGSPNGANEDAAVAVVAWALLPGACSLAHRLRTLTSRVDAAVASQLWLEIRTFPWQRLRKVAANVLASTRGQVLAEFGSGRAGRGGPPREVPVDPHSTFWQAVGTYPSWLDSAAELAEVLDVAAVAGVLTAADRQLLTVCLSQVAEVGGAARRGRGGLMAAPVVNRTAVLTGLSPATVRRRIRRAVTAVAAAHCASCGEAA